MVLLQMLQSPALFHIFAASVLTLEIKMSRINVVAQSGPNQLRLSSFTGHKLVKIRCKSFIIVAACRPEADTEHHNSQKKIAKNFINRPHSPTPPSKKP
jgi:hypothetical protein